VEVNVKTKNRAGGRFQKTCIVTAVFFSLQPALTTFGLIKQQSEVNQLEPGRPIEHKISGEQTHVYQITLTAGQFMRVVVEQKGIDLTLALAAPRPSRRRSLRPISPADFESPLL
jgi:hypothetical protein